ncbi:hypothetical protein LCGC14_1811070 [marine sediment metagenome]|uniref:Uncharacterized protein n=1 Tax=marine sediment metagenome TaxID=412755 RepID=A0A0F9GLX9_9ZZZZ
MADYTSGTAADEQDLVDQIDIFVTGTLGWTLIDTVNDTASINDRVYQYGPIEGKRALIVRWRGEGNYLYVYGYSGWVSSGDNDGELYSGTYSKIYCNTTTIDYWLFGGNDWLWVVIKDGAGTYVSAHGGFLHSYYDVVDDDIPTIVVGMNSNSYTYTSTRAYMYSATVSGSNQVFKADSVLSTSCLVNASPNIRDGSFGFLPLVMYCDVVGHREIRGELQGSFQANGTGLSSETWVTLSGLSEKVFVIKHTSNTNTYGFGPIPV